MSVESRLNRRGFLKGSITALGGAFIAGWLPDRLAGSNQVPIFIPKGSVSESGFSALIAGINTVFGEQTKPMIQMVENNLTSLIESIKSVFSLKGINVGLAYLTTQQASWVKPTLESLGKHLIIINPGENIVDPQLNSAFFHFVDLGLSRAAFYLGRWCALNLGKTCAILTQPELSGFDYLFAFRSGFEKSGGKINTLDFLANPADLVNTISRIKNSSDFVFTNLSAKNQLQVSTLGFINVSVNEAVMGGKCAYSISTWGKEHPLQYLGRQAAALTNQLINQVDQPNIDQISSLDNSIYIQHERKQYHKTMLVQKEIHMEVISQAMSDPVIFSDLRVSRSQVNQPFYL